MLAKTSIEIVFTPPKRNKICTIFINDWMKEENFIWFLKNRKHQIQIFPNTLKMITSKSKNTKFFVSAYVPNPNITKYTLEPTNTEIFKLLQYLVKPNFYP